MSRNVKKQIETTSYTASAVKVDNGAVISIPLISETLIGKHTETQLIKRLQKVNKEDTILINAIEHNISLYEMSMDEFILHASLVPELNTIENNGGNK